MRRWLEWDRSLFFWSNRRFSHGALDRFFGLITHLGGAFFTILTTLFLALLGPDRLSVLGWQSFAALSVSHGLSALIKKRVRRERPFRTFPEVKLGKHPLKDHSFPSGHTTAAFSVVTPFLTLSLGVAAVLLLAAATVGFSRMYLGYHYPSDCLAGALLGCVTAVIIICIS